MEKYRFRSTVYLVFLLVSLFVNGILFYMLISDEVSCKLDDPTTKEVDTVVLVREAENVYDLAYKMLNENKSNIYTLVDYRSINYPNQVCYLVNFSEFEKYFTEKAVSMFKDKLTEDMGNFYDCNDIINDKIFDSIFGSFGQGIRTLIHIYSNDDTMLVTGKLENSLYHEDKYPLYMILKKVNNKWLIDSFE